jgi:hypothetical protein
MIRTEFIEHTQAFAANTIGLEELVIGSTPHEISSGLGKAGLMVAVWRFPKPDDSPAPVDGAERPPFIHAVVADSDQENAGPLFEGDLGHDDVGHDRNDGWNIGIPGEDPQLPNFFLFRGDYLGPLNRGWSIEDRRGLPAELRGRLGAIGILMPIVPFEA